MSLPKPGALITANANAVLQFEGPVVFKVTRGMVGYLDTIYLYLYLYLYTCMHIYIYTYSMICVYKICLWKMVSYLISLYRTYTVRFVGWFHVDLLGVHMLQKLGHFFSTTNRNV